MSLFLLVCVKIGKFLQTKANTFKIIDKNVHNIFFKVWYKYGLHQYLPQAHCYLDPLKIKVRIGNMIKGKTGGSKEPIISSLCLGVPSDTVKISGQCQERLLCEYVQFAVCGPGKKNV